MDDQTTAPISLAGNRLSGNSPDLLVAGSGSQQIGGSSDDLYIFDGVGDDTLTGGGGHDTFVFGLNSGHDVITDFSGSTGVLDLRQTLVGNFGFSGLNIVQNGADAVVDLGDGNTVTLSGVNALSLTPGNFIFNV